MVTFVGFPLGGLTASLTVGPIDELRAAVLGGLLTGLILGAVQAVGLRGRIAAGPWILATGIGLAAGLGLGSAAVGFGTSLSALVVQGIVSGAGVGAAQAVLLYPRWGRAGLIWPVALGVIWASGWAVTTSIGVQVEDRFTVFGSSGALVVTALTMVLPLTLRPRSAS